jgi:hypothetical protein
MARPNLKSFGCSFIFGSELSDAACSPGMSIPSKTSYAAQLARHLGHSYRCYGRPGSGNLQIAEQVLSHIDGVTPTLFVIGWTWIDRFDYWGAEQIWYDTNWQTIMPLDPDLLARTYYKNLHSQYRDKLTTLMSIKLVIDTLKQHDQKFIMTYMDDLIFETEYHTSSAVINLQNYVKPYMTTFEGQTFLEWSKQNGYPISMSAHPLEEAHTAAADYILQLGVHKV